MANATSKHTHFQVTAKRCRAELLQVVDCFHCLIAVEPGVPSFSCCVLAHNC